MANQFISNFTQLWNNAGTTFNAIKVNVTNSASAAASKLMDLQIGGVSFFSVSKAGNVIAAGTGAFVGLLSTGVTTLKGSITNDSAAAGNIGEVISSTIVTGSAVSLTTTVAINVTSISLTAGDWDVVGTVAFNTAGTTSVTLMQGSISQTTNTLDTAPGSLQSRGSAAFVPGSSSTNNVLGATSIRISLASTTTIYLVASATFTVAGMGAYGQIRARRAR